MTLRERLRFDRNELAGAFGDVGTDLPLLAGMILAARLDPAAVFTVFGLLQILTGLAYGLPMPMQPLKAMAVLVITQRITGPVLMGGGLAIGLIMLALTLSGLLRTLARLVPTSVVRGIQFGLGLSLASLALRTYIPAEGAAGWVLAGVGLLVMAALWGSRRLPPGLLVIGLGLAFALWRGLDLGLVARGAALHLPTFRLPLGGEIWAGLLLLALPQLPLSLANSVIATEQTARDLFPRRAPVINKIGLTYALVNLTAPLLGGVPACHGCGGLAGHHAFGARTGGSVVIYGSFFLIVGLCFSGPLQELLKVFPLPILGAVLLLEALALLMLVRDQAARPRDLSIALFTGVIALCVPQGFGVGLLAGLLLHYGFRRFGRAEAGEGQAGDAKRST